MRKLLLLIIVSFSCLNLYSQNLSYLFQNDLPKDIHKYFTDQSVNDILTRDVELNPELLSWRLEYWKEIVENKNTDNDKNGLNSIRNLTSQAQFEKSNFLEDVKKSAGQNTSDEYKRKISDILNENNISSTQTLSKNYKIPEYDTNKMFFVKAKYLIGDRKLSYNKDESYKISIKQLESKYDSELRQKLSDMKFQQGNITMEYLECLINNWWLVKSNPGIANDLSFAIKEYIDQKYSIRKLGRIDISAGYAYTFSGKWYSYDIIYPIINRTDQISELKDYQSFVLQVDYKIVLKDLISFLSYINIGLNTSYASASAATHNDFSTRYRYNQSTEYEFSSMSYEANNIKINQQKFYSFYGKFSVPIFIPSTDLILHGGVLVGVNYLKADISYNYSVINGVYGYKVPNGITYVSLQHDLNIPKTESISSYIFHISPFFELNYNIFKNIQVRLMISGYNYFGIYTGLEF